MNDEERLSRAISLTQVLRPPRQALATFGATNIEYYLVTQPIYADGASEETVVRRGRVVANRPRIVTPYYLSQVEGFSADARRYLGKLMAAHGPHAPGIYYTYRNEPGGLDIASDDLPTVLERINKEIDEKDNPLAVIIQGLDEMWDVSLMKFIFEMTENSFGENVRELSSRGLLRVDDEGVPQGARLRIEEMFSQLHRGAVKPGELKDELERWGLFEAYQDRFLAMFRR
ncbi:MAG: hypothetical protein FWH51_00730 [Dehalococcoidia bacterium]|nr:hypothetical protein [Dehalococcoidia bacterium]